MNALDSLYFAQPVVAPCGGGSELQHGPESPGERPDEPDYSEYGDGKVFRQADVDRIVQDRLARDRRKCAEEFRDLQSKYQRLVSDHRLSEVERGKLQAALDEVNHQLEQVTIHERQELEERHRKGVAQAKANAEQWETRFKSLLTDRALAAAAAKHEAVSAEQLSSLLRDSVELVEDEQGEFVPMMPIEDEQGSSRLVPVDQAVARMKELPEAHGNLFKSNSVSGLGGNSTVGGVQPGASGVLSPRQASRLTPAEYQRIRREQPERMPWLGK